MIVIVINKVLIVSETKKGSAISHSPFIQLL